MSRKFRRTKSIYLVIDLINVINNKYNNFYLYNQLKRNDYLTLKARNNELKIIKRFFYDQQKHEYGATGKTNKDKAFWYLEKQEILEKIDKKQILLYKVGKLEE